MDGIFGGRMTVAVAVIAAAALAFTGLQLTGTSDSASASLPTPPTITLDPGAQALLDGQPDDGLNRFIVALEDPTAVVDGVPGTATEVTTSTEGGELEFDAREEDRFLDEDELSVADRALLEQLQGVQDGTSTTVTVAGAFDADDLLAVDGIEAVTPAGPGFAGITTSLDEAQVAALAGVAAVDDDELRTVAASYHSFQWGLANEEVPTADTRWDEIPRRARNVEDVVVAVIDSGVDLDHSDLAGSWWRNADEDCANGVDDDANGYVDDCTGWDFANGDNTVEDAGSDNNHGTHVSGIIAAADDRDLVTGVAPGTQIMPLKIFHNGASSSSRLAAAINYAIDNGADVINLSLGGETATNAEEQAVARASAAGIPVVVAAGNQGRNNDRIASYPAHYDYATVIAVGSSNSDDSRSRFSNYGLTTVDLFAPGGEILSTVPGGVAYMSGTSMAAPFVAGAAALLIHSGVAPTNVRSTLMDTAHVRQGLEGYSLTGARLDIAAAMGISRGQQGDPDVSFASFNDMRHWEADEAAVWVASNTRRALDIRNVVFRGTLGTVYDDQVYGIVEFPVTVGSGQVTTDEEGQFLLSRGNGLRARDRRLMRQGGIELPVGLSLPAGDYVLAVEVLDARNPDGGPVVDPGLIFFHVTEENSSAEDQVVIGDEVAPAPNQDGNDAPETTDNPILDVPAGDDGSGAEASDGTSAETDPGTGVGGVTAPGIGLGPDDGTDLVEGVVGDVTDGLDDITQPGGSAGDPEQDCQTVPFASTDSTEDGSLSLSSIGEVSDRGVGNAFGRDNNNGRGHAYGRDDNRNDRDDRGRDNSLVSSPPVTEDVADTVDDATGTTTETVVDVVDEVGSTCAVEDVVDTVEDLLDDLLGDLPADTVDTIEDILDDVEEGTGVGDLIDQIEDETGIDIPEIEDVAGPVTDIIEGGTVIDGTVSPDRGGPNTPAVSVSIPSGIPDGAFIRFGDSNAPITSRISDTRVMVQPPAREPGVVDVAVIHEGQRSYIPNGYTYLDADGDLPTEGDTVDTPGVEDVVDTPDAEIGIPEGGAPSAGSGGGAVEAPSEDDADTGAAGGAAGASGERGAFRYNGLLLDEVGSSNPLAGIDPGRLTREACETNVCAARQS